MLVYQKNPSPIISKIYYTVSKNTQHWSISANLWQCLLILTCHSIPRPSALPNADFSCSVPMFHCSRCYSFSLLKFPSVFSAFLHFSGLSSSHSKIHFASIYSPLFLFTYFFSSCKKKVQLFKSYKICEIFASKIIHTVNLISLVEWMRNCWFIIAMY